MLWKELRALLQARGVESSVLDSITPLLETGMPLPEGHSSASHLMRPGTDSDVPVFDDHRTHFERSGLGMSLALEEDRPAAPVTPSSARTKPQLLVPTGRSHVKDTDVLPTLPASEDHTIVASSDMLVDDQPQLTARLRPPPKRQSLRPKAMKSAAAADTRIMGAPEQEELFTVYEPSPDFDDLELHDPTLVVGLPKADTTDEDALEASNVFESVEERYKDLGLIGIGGMGEIRRMLDRNLNRIVAMKLLKPEYLDDEAMVERFFEEAQVTAQLEHPGIIPTHEVGRWIDGRIYFTMREIRGQTLAQVLQMSMPAATTRARKSRAANWSLRRLLNLFQRACEAVGYAHDRGVVHRDIKPANMIVGAHGEIQVVDWGLVKRLLPKSEALPEGKALRQTGRAERSESGILLGTPRYMAPEQILYPDEVDERSDVYALGIILYEILAGRTPYQDKSVRKILIKKMEGFPVPPGRLANEADASRPPWAPIPRDFPMDELHIIPEGLMEICAKSMAPAANDRYPNAGALAKVIEGWLAGLQKRRAAQEVVAQAAEKVELENNLRKQVLVLRQEAQALSQQVEDWEPEQEKWVMWNKEAEALILEQRAESLLIESIQLLQGALTHEPELTEAHLALAERYHAQHKNAEELNHISRLLHAEARLRHHVAALPSAHPTRIEYETYLQGDGWLTLDTEPAGAHVSISRYEPKGRRLVEVPLQHKLMTPVFEHALPYGSYLLRIEAPGCAEVRYPILIKRGLQWPTMPPDAEATEAIVLPAASDVAESECFVPRGWCLLGGDPDKEIPSCRVWVDDFIIQRFPVTNHEYLIFLNTMVKQGRIAEAMRCVPRERAGGVEEQGAMIYGQHPDGSFYLRTDADGDKWKPDWPVVMVDWHCAVAYARWLRRQTGLPWRLPWEVEWEKAARGVDGRLFPWGDAFDPSWCCMRQSRKDTPMLGAIGEFPIDRSVYGVCDIGGNVGDWCLDLFTKGALFVANERFVPPENQHKVERRRRVLRGGHWSAEPSAVRFSFRNGFREGRRQAGAGIRLVRPLHANTRDTFQSSQDFVAPKRLF